MITREFTIGNQSGLHLRPAGVLVNAMGGFTSDIAILFQGQRYNAKSITKILSANIKQGSDIAVSISGPDEEAAMAAMVKLVADGFGAGNA